MYQPLGAANTLCVSIYCVSKQTDGCFESLHHSVLIKKNAKDHPQYKVTWTHWPHGWMLCTVLKSPSLKTQRGHPCTQKPILFNLQQWAKRQFVYNTGHCNQCLTCTDAVPNQAMSAARTIFCMKCICLPHYAQNMYAAFSVRWEMTPNMNLSDRR